MTRIILSILILFLLSGMCYSQSWEIISSPEVGTSILNDVFFTSPTNGWVCGDGGTLLHTNDGGETWETGDNNPSNGNLYDIFFSSSENGWGGGIGEVRLIKTVNGGGTWDDATNIPQWAITSIHFILGEGWLGCGFGRIYHTTNYGNEWTELDLGIMGSVSDFHFHHNNNGWMSTGNGMYHTEDGENWTLFPNSGTELNDLDFWDGSVGFAVGYFGIVVKTIDNGANWNVIQTEYNSGFRSIDFVSQNHGWIVGDQGLILETVDGGLNWTPHSVDISMVSLNSVFFHDEDHGWAVGNMGTILKWNSDSNVDEDNGTPETFTLEPVYPNPFNQSANIQFTLIKSGNVELSIYNVLGERVEFPIDEYLEVGTHLINWDASEMPSGTYFVKLKVDNIVKTQSVTLLK
jgi:Photosynthesis system II assembly factor YCF48/Secretion system C-terminal sorting domain